ncbi:MoeB/ThiF family adenylyltransferase [Bacillus sp. Marseille-Q1617]|uniref:MoeB/ThiF family adenylyltransferase n=1 Tax=Bacillus sp. Marseille-Q1617 TaxID=2736887 RepID=UPI00158BA0D9|nr:MoeB/ThiF family adenylyltransferase [Bacillus sp. Marseille-Q1617]
MNDRYSRQELFPAIGEKGQKQLTKKHVLVIGAGALGSASSEALVRSGIGKLTIVDHDYVEWSNLQRQQLYTEKDVTAQMPKAVAAQNRLTEINSSVTINGRVMEATAETLLPYLHDVDLIIDATDNFDTRMMINDLSQKYNIPWIFGSCVGSTGMSYTVIPGKTACMNCLLDRLPMGGATCDASGIIAPAVGMVAAYQVTEAFKLLVGDVEALRGSLITFDLWNNQQYSMKTKKAKKSDCPSCGQHPTYPYLQYENQTKSMVLCGRNTVLIRSPQERNLSELQKTIQSLGETKINPYLLSLQYEGYRFVFFKEGRTLVHGTNSMEEAKKMYYKIIG